MACTAEISAIFKRTNEVVVRLGTSVTQQHQNPSAVVGPSSSRSSIIATGSEIHQASMTKLAAAGEKKI